jgi:hypothetical protein
MYEYLPYDHTKKYPEIRNFRAVVVEPKAGSQTVAIVSQSVNLDELGFDYLKRVRPHKCCKLLEVLIGPEDKLTPDLIDKLTQIPTACPNCDKIISIEVPSEPPNTRDQLAIWSKIWPCSFKQPSILPLTPSELSLDKILPILNSLSHDSTVLYNPLTHQITLGFTQEHPLKHSILSAIDKFDVKDNYYCSNMWVITTQEPCIMCGMALVHSRIDRLYFKERHHRGAFTFYKLHLKKLNYMYRIVRVKESIDS